jgi:hypothetical protein
MDREKVLEAAEVSGVDDYGPTSMCPEQFEPFADALERLYAIAYEAGRNEGRAEFAKGAKISVPSTTLEQEFQWYYRRGHEAGLQKGQQLAGEFICTKCGLRQDGEKTEPNF